MKIRTIKESDHKVVSKLLAQLGYPNTEKFIQNKIRTLLQNPNKYLVSDNRPQEKVLQ